jgi:alkylation response protein AidB-like acyl-CoA dehydrogenase
MEQKIDGKEKAMELAEESRQTEWIEPSFTAELFRGKFRWDLVHPYPMQDDDDKRIGDEYLEKLRGVMEANIDPVEIERTGQVPQSALKAMADAGAFGMKIEKKYGGLGLSLTNYTRALSLIGTYCKATSTYLSAHQSIGVPQPLKFAGTDEQREKYLPRLAAGELSAFALTEPDVGSDPAKMSTTAEPTEDGQHYILNGEKLWCTNGPEADILIVMAKTPSIEVHGRKKTQISAFIVESTMPGFEVVHRCEFMGIRGIANGLLRFNNVKVPAENIIGKPGDGLKIALKTLNTGRVGIPANSVAGAKLCLRNAQKWCNDRVQWGVPIGKHQEIAKLLADMAADTFAMSSISTLTCALADRGGADIRLEAAIAKYFCTETTWRIYDDFITMRGGRGYETQESLAQRGEEPMPAEGLMRDFRVMRILEGSTQIMRLIIAREALDTHFSLVMPLLKPRKGQKPGRIGALAKILSFYPRWLPKQFIPSGQSYSTIYLNEANVGHLQFINRTSRKLARRLFFTMAKYGPSLEREQLLLGNFVDIGVDLFVMASTLAYAERKLEDNPADQGPQELADLFCAKARERIEQNFASVRRNNYKKYDAVGEQALRGDFAWMSDDIYKDYPAALREMWDEGIAKREARAESEREVKPTQEPETPAPEETEPAHAEESVTK